MTDDAVQEILSGIDISALASQLDTDPETARRAAESAIPTLLGSLQANTADPEGQQRLLGALGQHSGEITDLDSIDTDDGRRILGHIFADQPQRLQPLAGQDGGLLAKLLPILAPLVLNWLARRVLGGSSAGAGQSGTEDPLGGLLGGILGGGPAGSGSGGGLGDILGQVLGGGLGGSQPGGQSFPGQPGGADNSGQWPSPGGQGDQQGSGDVLGDLLGQILGRR